MPILVATSVSLGWLGSIAEPAPSPSAATTSPATNIGPIIKFAELAYDFGKVDSGTVVKHEYAFTNIGDQTLEITNVQPSCGCTTAGKWDKAVEPGKTGMIPIEFNSTAYGGAVTKTITVTSNDPTNGVVVLQLKGTAWKPINISPGFVMFNLSADIQTNETKVVRIVSISASSTTHPPRANISSTLRNTIASSNAPTVTHTISAYGMVRNA